MRRHLTLVVQIRPTILTNTAVMLKRTPIITYRSYKHPHIDARIFIHCVRHDGVLSLSLGLAPRDEGWYRIRRILLHLRRGTYTDTQIIYNYQCISDITSYLNRPYVIMVSF